MRLQFSVLLTIVCAALAPGARAENSALSLDEKLRLFETFWEPKVAPACGDLGVSKFARLKPADIAAYPSMGGMRDWLTLSGGVISYPTGDSWNILFLEELLDHAMVTNDVVDFMLCHELGHFMSREGSDVDDGQNASEILADRFAIRECLPKYWESTGDELRKRMSAAVEGGMAYLEFFLENRAIGDTADSKKLLACREKADLALIKGGRPPRCLSRHFSRSFIEGLGSP